MMIVAWEEMHTTTFLSIEGRCGGDMDPIYTLTPVPNGSKT
jgi:hypothetical protein